MAAKISKQSKSRKKTHPRAKINSVQRKSPGPSPSQRILSAQTADIQDELTILQKVFDYSNKEIMIIRPDSSIVYLNDLALKNIGYPKKKALTLKLTDLLEHPISQQEWKAQYLDEIANSPEPSVFLVNRLSKRGTLCILELTIGTCCLKGEAAYLVIGKNITHQIELHKKIRESESFYRQVCEQSADAICTLSLEGKIIYANKAAEDMVKVKLTKDRSSHFLKYVEPGSAKKMKQIFKRVKSGEKVAFEKTKIVDSKGKAITIEITTFPVLKAGKVFQIHCIFRDVGKRVKVENLLLESQKMKALQLFISGTTYEIQNPLKGLLNRSQALINKYGDKSFEYIGYNEFKNIIQTLITMRDQIQYCCETNKRLIDISKRKIKLQKSSTDINMVIKETVKMFEHELKVLNIGIKMKLSPKLPLVNVSRIDLNQIFVNIFTNAIQSMLSGQAIVLKTKYLEKEKMVSFICQDQGVGISKDILPHVFEPFFTTKQRGLKKNAGLGLSIVYSIVTAAKGQIKIKSSQSRGTAVEVLLPT